MSSYDAVGEAVRRRPDILVQSLLAVAALAAIVVSAVAFNKAKNAEHKANNAVSAGLGSVAFLETNLTNETQVLAFVDGGFGLVSAVSTEGPQGPIGPRGVPGLQGEPGEDGTDGADGADGLSAAQPATINYQSPPSPFRAEATNLTENYARNQPGGGVGMNASLWLLAGRNMYLDGSASSDEGQISKWLDSRYPEDGDGHPAYLEQGSAGNRPYYRAYDPSDGPLDGAHTAYVDFSGPENRLARNDASFLDMTQENPVLCSYVVHRLPAPSGVIFPGSVLWTVGDGPRNASGVLGNRYSLLVDNNRDQTPSLANSWDAAVWTSTWSGSSTSDDVTYNIPKDTWRPETALRVVSSCTYAADSEIGENRRVTLSMSGSTSYSVAYSDYSGIGYELPADPHKVSLGADYDGTNSFPGTISEMGIYNSFNQTTWVKIMSTVHLRHGVLMDPVWDITLSDGTKPLETAFYGEFAQPVHMAALVRDDDAGLVISSAQFKGQYAPRLFIRVSAPLDESPGLLENPTDYVILTATEKLPLMPRGWSGADFLVTASRLTRVDIFFPTAWLPDGDGETGRYVDDAIMLGLDTVVIDHADGERGDTYYPLDLRSGEGDLYDTHVTIDVEDGDRIRFGNSLLINDRGAPSYETVDGASGDPDGDGFLTYSTSDNCRRVRSVYLYRGYYANRLSTPMWWRQSPVPPQNRWLQGYGPWSTTGAVTFAVDSEDVLVDGENPRDLLMVECDPSSSVRFFESEG